MPVEVVQFGWKTLLPRFEAAGARPSLRMTPGGAPLVTDGGHYIVDCAFEHGIADAAAMAAALRAPAGVVETGLFVDMATAVVVAGENVRVLNRRSGE